MAKENQRELDYDWYLLGNVEAASEYLKEGEEGILFAKKSLEKILEEAGESTEATRVLRDPDVLQKTIQSYHQTYREFRKEQTVGDLLERHSGTLEKYLGDRTEVAYKELEPFMDKKYEDILTEIKKADHIIKGKDIGMNSEEEAKEAEKTKEKYKNLTSTISILEGTYREKFKSGVQEELVTDGLRKMYNPYKEAEQNSSYKSAA